MKNWPAPERTIFELLVKRQRVVTESFEVALWGALPECQQPGDMPATVKVHICKLRKRLLQLGIELGQIHASVGEEGIYFIVPGHRDRARFVYDHYWSLITYSDENQLELFAHARSA